MHRIECKNAFIGCVHPGHKAAAQFLICKDCDNVAELENSTPTLQEGASNIGFVVDHSVVELTGTCADCQQNAG
ncbi:MAG: hypothetical protein GY770_11410 [Aestuariibacter sp.]|nr:hypothetical protein [Aestuariibacter sp.]